MSFEELQIEIARLENDLVKKESHFLASQHAGDRLNGALREELEAIKTELSSL